MGAGPSQLHEKGNAVAVAAPSFSLTVLPYAEARAALLDAEHQDHYRERCHNDRLNSIARAGQSYVAAKQTDTERVRCQAHLSRLLPSQFHGLGPVEVAYLLPSADGGLPHTRPSKLLCFPMSSSPVSQETLNHELWHVHQRTYRDQWRRFLKDAWHFVPYHETLPDKFNGMIRFNPDTLTEPLWIWQNTWVPVCLFTNPTTPTLKDTAVWFYNPHKKMYVTTIPPAMAEFFGTALPVVAYEHPYELAAYLLASGRPTPCRAYETAKDEFLRM